MRRPADRDLFGPDLSQLPHSRTGSDAARLVNRRGIVRRSPLVVRNQARSSPTGVSGRPHRVAVGTEDGMGGLSEICGSGNPLGVQSAVSPDRCSSGGSPFFSSLLN